MPRLSRREHLRNAYGEDYQPDMPPLKAGDYLIGYLWEIGPTMSGGGPVTHMELRAWMDLTGTRLQPLEVRMIRRLSVEYLVESRRAEKAHCRPPWKSLRALAKGD